MARLKPLIVFGPGPEMYFIGVGVHYYAVGMKDSVKVVANKWPAVQMGWMSINADGDWIVQDAYSKEIEMDLPIDLIQRLRSTGASNYVTFGPTKGSWLGIGRATWSGRMQEAQTKIIKEMQGQCGNEFDFDAEFQGILFGKGSTMILMFRPSFAYYMDEEAEGTKLENLLNSYLDRSPPWTIERGSSLCPWNVNYYFIVFKDPQSGAMEMVRSLPPDMNEDYNELNTLSETHEAQIAIAQNQQLGLSVIREKQMYEQAIASMKIQMSQMRINAMAGLIQTQTQTLQSLFRN